MKIIKEIKYNIEGMYENTMLSLSNIESYLDNIDANNCDNHDEISSNLEYVKEDIECIYDAISDGVKDIIKFISFSFLLSDLMVVICAILVIIGR